MPLSSLFSLPLRSWRGRCAALLLGAGSLALADDPHPPRGTPLFNGKDLSGWKTTGNWRAETDGTVAITPRPGESGWTRYDAYLTSERTYKDFVFDVEFKIPKGGNSGVFFRIKDPKNPVATGIECQILDSFGKEGLGHHDNGGIIQTTGPKKNASRPAGEWNRMILTCRGSQLRVNLNGEEIVDVDLSNTPMKDRPLEGYISLQDHGLPLTFRNAYILELSDPEKSK